MLESRFEVMGFSKHESALGPEITNLFQVLACVGGSAKTEIGTSVRVELLITNGMGE